MLATKDAIVAEALSLNEADRREVLNRLAASLDEPIDAVIEASWDVEIDRRLDNIASGKAIFTSWDVARRRIVGDRDASDT